MFFRVKVGLNTRIDQYTALGMQSEIGGVCMWSLVFFLLLSMSLKLYIKPRMHEFASLGLVQRNRRQCEDTNRMPRGAKRALDREEEDDEMAQGMTR